jgi:hypothetical protein
MYYSVKYLLCIVAVLIANLVVGQSSSQSRGNPANIVGVGEWLADGNNSDGALLQALSAVDGKFASVSKFRSVSNLLRLSKFNFAIPENSIITGVEVAIVRLASQGDCTLFTLSHIRYSLCS